MRGSNEPKVARARELRHVGNDAEEKLWHELRGRRLNGFKFVRQLPIGPYFADFACREKTWSLRSMEASTPEELRICTATKR